MLGIDRYDFVIIGSGRGKGQTSKCRCDAVTLIPALILGQNPLVGCKSLVG